MKRRPSAEGDEIVQMAVELLQRWETWERERAAAAPPTNSLDQDTSDLLPALAAELRENGED
ncbi:MAG: hypothetical protein IT161_18845 [Bryobacterales bacterium]|nr:hypothetical protein [Bryobacterales bacterium]